MKRALLLAVMFCGVAHAQADKSKFQGVTMRGVQTVPPEPAQVSEATKQANIKVVWAYYQHGDDYSDKTMLKLMSPNFIQHDPCEASTEAAYAAQFRRQIATRGMNTPPTKDEPLPVKTVHDSAGHAYIREIVADGDIVVAMRDMWRPWPGGPRPYMKTTFVDVWRVRNGKILEEWPTIVPGDGFSSKYRGNCLAYHDDQPSVPPLLAP